MTSNGAAGGGWLADEVSLAVLADFVPREVIDEVVAAAGRRPLRRDGKLPPHVVVYLVMIMAVFADAGYEEAAARLAGLLGSWGCWDAVWEVPTSGGITQARQRLGWEPVAAVFAAVAVPAASVLSEGAFLGRWRLMAIDGTEFDVPDTAQNAAEFGRRRGAGGEAAFPKARVVSICECGSRAFVAAEIGGKGTGEQALAARLYPGLDKDWLLIADRNFYSWKAWGQAAGTGAALLWRVKKSLRLPAVAGLPDGSQLSVLINPAIDARSPERDELLQAARRGDLLDPDRARLVRVIEYQAGQDGEQDGDEEDEDGRIILITTITDPGQATAAQLAAAYHRRWEHETAHGQLKTVLRGPGRVLRSRTPDLVRQEIYGYLLTHYAVSALICAAAEEAGLDPGRVSYTRTVRVIRHATAAFPP
jgi:hypothetical protein